MRLVVIAPLAYRLRKGCKVLYRQPAYLLCTDVHLPLAEVVQHYLWRWGIEVNFREQKTLLGTGEAQVRTEASNQQLPAMTVAAYALLWTAALSMAETACRSRTLLKPPKWRSHGQSNSNAPPNTGTSVAPITIRDLGRFPASGDFSPLRVQPILCCKRTKTPFQACPPHCSAQHKQPSPISNREK